MNNSKTILVIGATGNQGGAVIKSLLKTDFKIRGLTRSIKSNKAKLLVGQGIELIEGDLDDFESLKKAMKDCYGVYSVQNFMTSGVKKEIEQGKNVAVIAKENGIQHFVYSSVGGAERNSGIPHFDSKREIEKEIISLEIPFTIIRPTFFYENLSKMSSLMVSMLKKALGDKKLQMICVEDIGKWVALAFQNPLEYLNKEIEIAGDELNSQEIIKAFSTAQNKKIRTFWLPDFLVFTSIKDFGLMFKWFRDFGYEADLISNKKVINSMLSFEGWLKKNK